MNIKSIFQVIKMDEQKIVFSDGEILEFSECVKIFNTIYLDSNSKCVAQRNITANPPYFEFYANPMHLKIIFDYKGFFKKFKTEKAVHSFQKQILKSGFTTYDLS